MARRNLSPGWRFGWVFLLGLLVGVLGLIALLFLVTQLSHAPQARKDATDNSELVDPSPIALQRKSLDLLPAEVTRVGFERLALQRPASLSIVLHAIHLYGWDVRVPHPTDLKRSDPALRVVLDYRLGIEYFGGQAPLVSTRDGVRCRVLSQRYKRSQGERQAHSGQLLATLAEAGVPLSTPLTTSSGKYEVHDVLDDTVANFSIDDPELEWTGVALAIYLSPQAYWKDKFGRESTFDQLARRLIATPFDRPGLSCQGTHLLYALTVILRVNEQRQILSQDVAESIQRYLSENVSRLCRNQSIDGAWPIVWYSEHPEQTHEIATLLPSGITQKLSVTIVGHHLEWMLLLPDYLAPPNDVYRRAGLWLDHAVDTAEQNQLSENYCPYSHAAFVLSRLSATDKNRSDKEKGHLAHQPNAKDFMKLAIRGS